MCLRKLQGKFSGLCGNFDLKTVNEMKTPDNMDLSTPQEFGNSWTAAKASHTDTVYTNTHNHIHTSVS